MLASTAASYLETLNPEQRRAVEHGVTADSHVGAPLLVIAGAGSGKTNTLAHRVAHLIVSGADPRRILLMTFSRRAASEMSRRVERIARKVLGADAGIMTDALSWAGTFHGIGARLLREYADQIGLNPAFTIHDREDSADLMNLVRHERGLSKTESRFPTKGTCLSIYSRCVNAEAELDQVLGASYLWCAGWANELKELFAAYVEAKQKHNVLDYDDLLLYWAQMMSDAGIADDVGGRFDHVLVDEYQDTNRLQSSVLLALKPGGRGLTVVGDDAQAIYSFRAATVENILEFPDRFTPRAEVIALAQNYRSTQAVLDVSNALMAEAPKQFRKHLLSLRGAGSRPRLVTVDDLPTQAEYVCTQVLKAREANVTLRRQAVLFRSASHSDLLEVELSRRKIPFIKYGGLKFLEAAHVKDLLAILRWIDNPRNAMAGFRVLQLLKGMGPVNARRALNHLFRHDASFGSLREFDPPADCAVDWRKLVELLVALVDPQRPWTGQLNQVREWYRPHLERLYEHVHTRIGDLDQLELLSGQYPSRERFITELTLDPPQASGDLAGQPLHDEDYLVLSTVHSAKGMEWDSVYVLNVVDGSFPSEFATGRAETIEEERRLLYVAMTRAKDDLTLVQPLRFQLTQQPRHGDAHVYGARSRFMTEKVLKTLDEVGFQGSSLGEASLAEAGQSALDAIERVKSMW
ncbi:MAG: ATP-dependent helicase [Steroidobacteraceae bacterium]|nr:ATP-dependent helicase [Steroidobacteraceae bacterium]